MADRIMTCADVRRATGLSRTTIWRLERAGEFPPRRRIVGHRIGWIEAEVDAWIAARPTVRLGADRAAERGDAP